MLLPPRFRDRRGWAGTGILRDTGMQAGLIIPLHRMALLVLKPLDGLDYGKRNHGEEDDISPVL